MPNHLAPDVCRQISGSPVVMNQTHSPHFLTLERSQLDLSLHHTRIRQHKQLNSLQNSIETYGQLVPVIVIRLDGARQKEWLLIDGFRRVEALMRLHIDQVCAERWCCSEQEALIKIIVQKRSRQFEAVEQAIMIQELMQRCKLTASEIARLLGRNACWVSRRISLVEALDDKLLQDVMKGLISIWAATRVLAPLARANSEHSQKLGAFLREHSPSTRDVEQLWKYYQKAPKSQREKLVEFPDSFLKSLQEQQKQKDSQKLKNGIEGKWLHDVSVCKNILQRMRKNMDELFSPSQSTGDRNRLKTAFDGLTKVFEELGSAVERRCND